MPSIKYKYLGNSNAYFGASLTLTSMFAPSFASTAIQVTRAVASSQSLLTSEASSTYSSLEMSTPSTVIVPPSERRIRISRVIIKHIGLKMSP